MKEGMQDYQPRHGKVRLGVYLGPVCEGMPWCIRVCVCVYM